MCNYVPVYIFLQILMHLGKKLAFDYRSIFADDDGDEDDNVADTLGISSKPVVNGEPVKNQAEKQTTNDEVREDMYIPLLIILLCFIISFVWNLWS